MYGLFGVYTYEAVVRNVVDSGTLDLVVDLGFKIHINARVILARIDVYETRLGKKTTQKEKDLGVEAKQFVQTAVEGNVVQIETEKIGKHGKYIAEVRYMKRGGVIFTNLSTELIRLGHAVKKEY